MSNGKIPDISELSEKVPDISELTDKDPNIGILPGNEGARQFGGGIIQGAVFDPVTGINQLIEHATSNKVGLPDSVKNWLENYKDKYTSGPAGQFGEGVGTVGSAFIPGGLIAKGVSKLPAAVSALSLPRTAGALSRVGSKLPSLPGRTAPLSASQRALTGAGIGATGSVMQPVEEGGDFSRKKGLEALAGSVGGGLAGPLAAPVTGGASAYVASEMIHKLGWPAALGIFSALGTSLASLAHHHGLGQAAMKLKSGAEKVLDRPGAQYAVGRAAGAGTDKAQELLEDNQ